MKPTWSGISKLCYELYKVDWKECHGITPEVERNTLRDFYVYNKEIGFFYDTYEEYINDLGYLGAQIYACYEEFYEIEYQDRKYMCNLLDNSYLYEEYLQEVS